MASDSITWFTSTDTESTKNQKAFNPFLESLSASFDIN